MSISLTATRDVTFDYFKTCPKGSSQFFCLKSKNEKSKKKNLTEINDYVKKKLIRSDFFEQNFEFSRQNVFCNFKIFLLDGV